MSHVFNDSVIYVRNGKPIPAIVLSSLQSDKGELLTLLYAQPEIGPTLLAQGTTRGIAQVQQAVQPFVEGNVFGWRPWGEVAPVEPVPVPQTPTAIPDRAPEQLDEAQGPVTPGAPESPHAIEQAGGHQGAENPDGGEFGHGVGTIPEGITIAPEVPLVEGEPGSTSDNPLPG